MSDLRYTINLNYVPSRPNGREEVLIGGATQSVLTYSPSYYQAYMPEIKVFATGSSYTEALDNILLIATYSNEPLSNIKTY